MQKITIDLTNKQVREYNYFLSSRYGKRKSLKTKLKIAVMEIVAIQAKKEVNKALKDL